MKGKKKERKGKIVLPWCPIRCRGSTKPSKWKRCYAPSTAQFGYAVKHAIRQQRHFTFTALCVALPLAFIKQLVFTTLGWVITLSQDKHNCTLKIQLPKSCAGHVPLFPPPLFLFPLGVFSPSVITPGVVLSILPCLTHSCTNYSSLPLSITFSIRRYLLLPCP